MTIEEFKLEIRERSIVRLEALTDLSATGVGRRFSSRNKVDNVKGVKVIAFDGPCNRFDMLRFSDSDMFSSREFRENRDT